MVDVTTFGNARALSDWSLRIDSSSNASRKFSRNVICFPKFPRYMINYEIQETNIFIASVFITKRSASDAFNHWKITCFTFFTFLFHFELLCASALINFQAFEVISMKIDKIVRL